MLSSDPDIRRIMALRAIESGLLRLRWLAAATRFEIAMRRHDRALKYAYKYGYNPSQPRVPRGQSGAGEWTADGTSSNRVRLAGDIPTGNSPEVPKERPTNSADRTAAQKLAARLLGPAATVATIAKMATWLTTYAPEIISYNDPPKSLEELQQAVSDPAPGYDIHHVVQQNQEEHFAREIIDSPDNLVRVPRLRHQEINGWYERKNPDFDGMSPRKYLDGRNWDVQRAVGLEALRKFGVLKP
jgi:hypothetical protein